MVRAPEIRSGADWSKEGRAWGGSQKSGDNEYCSHHQLPIRGGQQQPFIKLSVKSLMQECFGERILFV